MSRRFFDAAPEAAQLREQIEAFEAREHALSRHPQRRVEIFDRGPLGARTGREQQMCGLDGVAGTLEDRGLHEILELTHVPRPVIGQQQVHGVVAHAANSRTLQA